MPTTTERPGAGSIQERRDTLAAQATAAREALEDARRRLIEGEAEAGDVTEAQNRVTVLDGALTQLDARLEAERERAARHQAEAGRERGMERLCSFACQATESLARHERLRAELAEQLRSLGRGILQARGEVLDARREFLALARSYAPGIGTLHYGQARADDSERREEMDALVQELEDRGADLDAVRAHWGLTSGGSALDLPLWLERTGLDDIIADVLAAVGRAGRG